MEKESFKTEIINEKVGLLDYETESSDIFIPEGIEIISEKSFTEKSRKQTETVELSNSVETIAARTFADMKALNQVRLSSELKEIGEEAFLNCELISKIRFPYSLKKIGKNAFKGTGISVCVLPGSVEIEKDSFPENCKINRIDEYGSEWF